jgi:hypothetical protein
MPERHALTPTQQIAFDELVRAAVPGQVVVLVGNQGTGRTTLLKGLGEQLDGAVLGAPALETAVSGHHPLAIEDAFYDLIGTALDANRVVLVDDFQYLAQTIEGCRLLSARWFHLRRDDRAQRARRRARLHARHRVEGLDAVTDASRRPRHHSRADGGRLPGGVRLYLAEDQVAALDFPKIFRFARRMNARQLRRACESTRAKLSGSTATGHVHRVPARRAS